MSSNNKSVFDIKGDCINKQNELIKRQRELVTIAKAGVIQYEEFQTRFHAFEIEIESLEEPKNICDEIISLHIKLDERLG